MARLITSGAELKTLDTTTHIGSPDGIHSGTTAGQIETSIVRSGAAAWRFLGGGAVCSRQFPVTMVAGTTYYARAYMYFIDWATGGTISLMRFGTASAQPCFSVRISETGRLRVYNDSTGTQLGSDSAVIPKNVWYRVELKVKLGAGAVDEVEVRFKADGDGAGDVVVVHAATGLSVQDTLPTTFSVGWVDNGGSGSCALLVDDVAVNDSTGTKENSWPADEHVYLLTPRMSGVIPGLWDSCVTTAPTVESAGTILSLRPPQGHADATGHTAPGHQWRHTGSGGGSDALSIWPHSLASAGVPGSAFHPGHVGPTVVSTIGSSAASDAKVASSFYMNGLLTNLELNLYQNGGAATDDLIVEIFGNGTVNGADGPTGTALASATKPISEISAWPPVWHSFPFNLPLSPATKYWIVLGRSGAMDGTNHPVAVVGDTLSGSHWLRKHRSDTSTWLGAAAAGVLYRAHAASGVPRVSLMQAFACHGEAIATGTKTGSLNTASPASTAKTFNFGDDVGAAGTYPTNWRYVRTDPVYEPAISHTATDTQVIVTRTDTTSRVALLCAAGIHVCIKPVDDGWQACTKNVGATSHLGLYMSIPTSYFTSSGTEVIVPGGHWAVIASPMPEDGNPATITVVEDSAFKTDYTLA